MQGSLGLLVLLTPLVSSFSVPAAWNAHGPPTRVAQFSSSSLCSSVGEGVASLAFGGARVVSGAPSLRMQSAPSVRMQIPDSFNPAEWSRKSGGGIPDSFNPAQMEREQGRGTTATLERPVERKNDMGKDYRVLLFNDESNTREFVTQVLMKYIPDMTPDLAKMITQRTHNTGMGVVGTWVQELAEGYSAILNENGLKSDVEEDS